MSDDCIFCKIIAGAIPCHKLFEDDNTLVFLDISPLSEGHCLVIPKFHAAKVHELPASAMAALGPVLGKVAGALGCENYNILQNNGAVAHQVVMHVHFHIIPKPNEAEGLQIGWPTKSGEGLAEFAEKIKAKLA
eukprot:PhM_4_TR7987/c0_g1_i1/m.13353